MKKNKYQRKLQLMTQHISLSTTKPRPTKAFINSHIGTLIYLGLPLGSTSSSVSFCCGEPECNYIFT